ncbi:MULTISPECIES: DUF4469 domain-containing protein [Parabacteroides]|uniref:DUF4469 domain-containing protein n=1 Tax=Parabacteroides leei TaxID=2939491 RepID=UPI00189A7F8A|nr:DUF4469 domain-containing protein [Parabacteroides goldsteinii]
MATTTPKMRSIAGLLVPNYLTEREDDFTFNVTYLANRTVKDLCKLAAQSGSKFSASELESAYNDLLDQAKTELYSASTVEFGFTNNSLGVDGPFIGPKAAFNPEENSVSIRSSQRAEFREDLKKINVIVSGVEENLPTITRVIDIVTEKVNSQITPGGNLNGEGKRIKIVGTEGKTVGFFFINADNDTETAVSKTAVSRNDPSFFSFTIPALANGSYYLEIASQYGGNSKTVLKEVRRNRFPYKLTVDNEDDRPVIE